MGTDAFVEQLKTIPDWRRGRAVQHPLWLMLLMTLLGVMSGYSRGMPEAGGSDVLRLQIKLVLVL